MWDLHVSLHKNPRETSYLQPIHLVILSHRTQLPPLAEGEVKTAGGAEPILRQPGYSSVRRSRPLASQDSYVQLLVCKVC